MARVYREMRAEILDSQDGSRLVAALAIMQQTREFRLIEQDLLKMRQELNNLQNSNNRGDNRPLLGVIK